MNQLLDAEIRNAAETGAYVEYNGLRIFPITMAHYEIFCACESALTLRQSTLPAIYAAKSFAQSLFEMAMPRSPQTDAYGDLWSKLMTLVCLSLKIPIQNAQRQIKHHVDATQGNKLVALEITQYCDDGEFCSRVTTQQISEIRKIIASLNGRNLPDESENAEIIEAENDIRDANRWELDVDCVDLLASVARDQRVRIKDVRKWTIYEFEYIRSAIERERRFSINGIGEMGGMVKWKNGNPVPSLFFNKRHETEALIDVGTFKRRLGSAVQETDSIPNLPIT